MTREFTEADVRPSSSWDGRIECDRTQLIPAPTWWMQKGLSQTASGYGKKLMTAWKIRFNGRLLRVYCCCFSNAGTCYIKTKGRSIIIDAT
jgi:hypothetical protein